MSTEQIERPPYVADRVTVNLQWIVETIHNGTTVVDLAEVREWLTDSGDAAAWGERDEDVIFRFLEDDSDQDPSCFWEGVKETPPRYGSHEVADWRLDVVTVPETAVACVNEAHHQRMFACACGHRRDLPPGTEIAEFAEIEVSS